MIYVVLGMHKSGTTLVSEILHKSGVSMVEANDENKSYDAGNKMERVATLQMDHDLLNSRGVHSLDIKVRDRDIVPSVEQKERMTGIVEQCNTEHTSWGFKDPRACITYPAWESVLPEHKMIIVYRHPAQVIQHYRKTSSIYKRRSRIVKALQKWKENNQNLIDFAKKYSHETIVINYLDLMTEDRIFDKLSDFTGQELFDARKKSSYRQKSTKSSTLKIYDLLAKEKAIDVYNELESMKV